MSDYKLLPKVELHLHLDSSLSYEAVQLIKPEISPRRFKNLFVAPAKCENLPDYLERVANQVDLLQTESSLKIATQSLVRQLQDDYVIYAEIRFAPLLHTRQGLSAGQVLETVCDTLNVALLDYDLEARIIVCSLRDFSEKESMKTVQLASEFKNTGVAGFDLAGDEKGFPLDNHIKAFRFAKEHDICRTAHAGEACGSNSVGETLQKLETTRIGHGVRSYEDAALLKIIKEKNIHLEICPTSNIQTNVYDSYSDHTIDRFYEQGISLSINTDGRTTSNVSLTDEYKKLHRTFGWTEEHFLHCNLNALDAAFIPEEEKQKLKPILEAEY